MSIFGPRDYEDRLHYLELCNTYPDRASVEKAIERLVARLARFGSRRDDSRPFDEAKLLELLRFAARRGDFQQ